MSMDLLSMLFGLPIFLVMAVIAVLIILVVTRLGRSPSRQAAAQGVPPGNPAAVRGQWQVHVRREGHLDPFSGFGTLTLANGTLSYQPEDDSTSGWSHPVASFGVWSNAAIANSDLTLDSAETGQLGLTVSHERINRFSRNTFKTFRERDTSGEFARAMQAAGATLVG